MIVFRTDLLFFTVITSFTASAGKYLSYFQEGPISPIFPATGAGFIHAGGFVAPREWKLHGAKFQDFNGIKIKINSVAFSPQANYTLPTDRRCRRS
jgi:hypothetical protein